MISKKFEKVLTTGLYVVKTNCLLRYNSLIIKQNLSTLSYATDGNRISPYLKHLRYNLHFSQIRACATNNNELEKNLQQEPELIYVGKKNVAVVGTKLVSYSTSILTLIFQAYLFNSADKISLLPGLMMACLGCISLLSTFVIHFVLKGYVFLIYYDPVSDIYSYRTQSLFLTYKMDSFRLSDVTDQNSLKLFSAFHIKGKPIIVFQDGFLDENHFVRLMKYDQPLDVNLNGQSEFHSTPKKV